MNLGMLQGDVYVRYLSFSSAAELKAAMTDKLPHKIDIGAVYTAKVWKLSWWVRVRQLSEFQLV